MTFGLPAEALTADEAEFSNATSRLNSSFDQVFSLAVGQSMPLAISLPT